MTPAELHELAAELTRIGGSSDEAWPEYALRLEPLVDRIAARELRAAADVARCDHDARRLRYRADALDPT